MSGEPVVSRHTVDAVEIDAGGNRILRVSLARSDALSGEGPA